MNPTTLQISQAAPIATITLNRPDKRNALDAATIAELTAAFSELGKRDDVRIVVLRGNGSAFCAGADLSSIKALQTASFDDNLADGQKLTSMFQAVYSCPKATIALVHGPALAGGAGLASACDFAIASQTATFGYPEARIGFVAAIVMVLLTRQVGERAARDLVLTGRTVRADEALELRLVNRVVPDDRLDAALNELCDDLLRNSPASIALSKQLLAKVWSGELEANLETAARFNATARQTSDCKEGVAAFLEKRKPRWVR